MDLLLHIGTVVLCGLVVLTILVAAHEWGHLIAARICGVRVAEYFIGMSCPLKLAWTSKKTGTTYGITPLFLGGYTLICGMASDNEEHNAAVFSCIQKHGRISAQAIADELQLDLEQVYASLEVLLDWRSVEAYEDVSSSSDQKLLDTKSVQDVPEPTEGSELYQTVDRDQKALTRFDKTNQIEEQPELVHRAGEAYVSDMSSEEFYNFERKRNYAGASLIARLFILLGGIIVNVILGFTILIFIMSILGIEAPAKEARIGQVIQGSYAAEAGLQPKDIIVKVGDRHIGSWDELVQLVPAELKAAHERHEDCKLVFMRNGVQHSTLLPTSKDSDSLALGVYVDTEVTRLSIPDAFNASVSYIVMVGKYAFSLLNPAKTVAVVQSSTSIIGVSVIAADAAREGITPFIYLIAAVSLSLAFMNLLPILPLDGGRILMELIGAIIRRPVPVKLQNILTILGLALFLCLFVVLTWQDITRFIIPG